ncbi:MAG: CYTH domain-containing protein [Treponema sp.]|jgi:adenylate cyclase class 2|nr:CYTH domain-containing protein [Treponema sp.]
MAIEIEVKAWVDTPESLKQRIDAIARFTGVFDKTDAYWYPAPILAALYTAFPASGVRVRKEVAGDGRGDIQNGIQTTRITYKAKEVRDDIEVNHEREFTVSDGAVFEDLLTALGLIPIKRKRKTGWVWVYNNDALNIEDGITVELALLERLGYFIELEIIADNDAADTVAAARGRLLALLDLLGIARNRIESRYYTDLLGQ